MAWNHRSVTNKTRMFTIFFAISQSLSPKSTKCISSPVWPSKIILRLLAATLSTTAIQLSATSVLIQQNQRGDCKQKRCTRCRRSRTESFVSVDFLISSEQYANTCMAVLIRRVTSKSLFSFWGQRKVLSCEIHLRGLRPCFFHGGALVLFWTATKSATFLKNFQVNLHFTHYAQGKYVIEREFLYL